MSFLQAAGSEEAVKAQGLEGTSDILSPAPFPKAGRADSAQLGLEFPRAGHSTASPQPAQCPQILIFNKKEFLRFSLTRGKGGSDQL